MFPSTTLNVNNTKLFCGQYAFIVANGGHIGVTTMEISVPSHKKRGKLCHLISIQSTHFVHQLQVENVRVLIFFSFPLKW